MEHRIEEMDGIRCSIRSRGQGGPVIYWGTAHSGEQQEERVTALVARSTGEAPWTLVAYEVENWNRDYSPWVLPGADDPEDFTGGAKNTLAWLAEVCIPYMESKILHGMPQRMIGGYSLAGLFSLFAFYESRLFNGVASCSGSLWYPGWQAYADLQKSPQDSIVYLSLGRKEEKTRSRRMAAVGEMTRWQYERIRRDENVRESELIWHNGGHFSDVEQRIAQGFAWLIEHAGNS